MTFSKMFIDSMEKSYYLWSYFITTETCFHRSIGRLPTDDDSIQSFTYLYLSGNSLICRRRLIIRKDWAFQEREFAPSYQVLWVDCCCRNHGGCSNRSVKKFRVVDLEQLLICPFLYAAFYVYHLLSTIILHNIMAFRKILKSLIKCQKNQPPKEWQLVKDVLYWSVYTNKAVIKIIHEESKLIDTINKEKREPWRKKNGCY